MIDHLDAWIELNQGGRLLDRHALEMLADPSPVGSFYADRLRDALTAPFGNLLDVVLQEGCGLENGWRKGPEIGASYAESLLDGTVEKPRRVLECQGQLLLCVFTVESHHVGQHKGRREVAHVVEYLRRRRVPLGLVTNGREWRLVFADPDNLAWVEWVADRWLEGDNLSSTFALLRRVLSPEAVEQGRLLEAIRQTRRGQARLSKELGERVRACVELLLQSRRPVLDSTFREEESKSLYDATCHFVMRLVVVLFAEARELLPVDNAIYHQAYGLRGLLEGLERAGADRRRARVSAWPRLLALFRLLHQGSEHPQLVVTSYGGDLFKAGDLSGDAIERSLALIEEKAEPPTDEVVYRMLVLLTRTTERVREGAAFRLVAAPVDFTELTSEYIGILYEGLLDYELHRAGNEPIVFLGLGDQPALPLDRLEAMPDKQLSALVEKAKVKKSDKAKADSDESDDEEADAEEEADVEDDAPEAEEVPVLDDIEPDDARSAALKRAMAWAERAAIAGKLVKAPKGKKGATDQAWKAELERTSRQLIAAVKLPGELYLVRWGGTRKGAGTFYTRPQLTLPTVRRTLEPLVFEEGGRTRPPEALLALKVCDPAMGSGSFLVAALRVLTEAVVRSLHEHGRIVRCGDLMRIECDLLPDADRDQPEDHIESIVRRAVVEHCLYGVDLDPLAVELARVSLWVETLDRRLPFTFLLLFRQA